MRICGIKLSAGSMSKHAHGGRLQAGSLGTDEYNRESDGEVRAGDADTYIRSTLKEALQGTYRIQKRIGEGGMVDLYLATHEELGGKWAVKVLGRDLVDDSEVVERFVTEARIGAELQHPNIVKVFHIGRAGKFRYLVMNYVEGEDLAARTERSSPMPESEIVSIAAQICRVLECAHDHQVVHRDLKPSNIRIDNYGTVLVLDFGIARARDIVLKTRTAAGERLGTPLYMSPEQVRGDTADARSDLYSLGILMYEMATGSNPFDAESPHAVYRKQLNDIPPPVSQLNSAFSVGFSRVVERLVQKDPEKRFQTASQVVAKFESAGLAQRHVTPRPANLPEAFQGEKVLRRQPATIRADALSSDQRKILDCVDSRRSVQDVLRLTSLDSGRFTSALNDLVERQAVSLAQSPAQPGTPAAEGKATIPVPHREISPIIRIAFLLVVGAAVIALAFFAGGLFLVEVEPVALTVDASPYAVVEVVDADRQSVFIDETPFVVSLPPGDYSLEFTYGSRQVIRSVALGPAAPGEVHCNFWEGTDVESLLERVLSEGVEE